MQATSPRRGATTVSAAELKAFAETLNEIGKKTSAMGIPLVFHPHMNQIGQNPEDVEAILKCLRPALRQAAARHRALGGGRRRSGKGDQGTRQAAGDAAHQGRQGQDTRPSPTDKKYEFVELGQGKVDFPAVFAALKAGGYNGWAVVELDRVPEGRAPKDAAIANKAFLEKTLGLKVG